MSGDSAGERLRKIRLEKGLSLEEVHKKTKIHLNILKAIEEDNLVNLSPIYIKGFLKIYCQFLGVEPKDYIKDYKEPQAGIAVARQEKPVSVSNRQMIVPKLARLIGVIFNRKTLLGIVIILAVVIAAFGVKKAVTSFSAHRARALQSKQAASRAAATQPKKRAPAKAVAPKVQQPVVSQPPRAVVKQYQAVAEPAQKELASGIRLGIHAKDDCWVQVKIDGKAAFQSVLKKGRFEVWQAKDKIELSLGNVANVDLEINGKLITELGRKGQPLRNILITKEGLKIER
jgi:cytoskeleton protein RodZ